MGCCSRRKGGAVEPYAQPGPSKGELSQLGLGGQQECESDSDEEDASSNAVSPCSLPL
jgi:hypothetical protein